MHNDYTIYFLRPDSTWGEPLYLDRRSLKCFLEDALALGRLPNSPDSVLLTIDAMGLWDCPGCGLRVMPGHQSRRVDPLVKQIQDKLRDAGVAYVKYEHEDRIAVLKLVRTGEFRYDRYWLMPGESDFRIGETGQDDGRLNPGVHTGLFQTESEAVKWLTEQAT